MLMLMRIRLSIFVCKDQPVAPPRSRSRNCRHPICLHARMLLKMTKPTPKQPNSTNPLAHTLASSLDRKMQRYANQLQPPSATQASLIENGPKIKKKRKARNGLGSKYSRNAQKLAQHACHDGRECVEMKRMKGSKEMIGNSYNHIS